MFLKEQANSTKLCLFLSQFFWQSESRRQESPCRRDISYIPGETRMAVWLVGARRQARP